MARIWFCLADRSSLPSYAEAQVVVPIARFVVVPVRGAAVLGVVVPAAAAVDSVRAAMNQTRFLSKPVAGNQEKMFFAETQITSPF